MPEHFADRLDSLCAARGPVCAGIDPRPPFPDGLDAAAFAEAVAALLAAEVPSIKPQLAFFADEWDGPRRVALAARGAGCLTIADCKRGDIESTAEAYARALLGSASPFDAVTVNPYLGRDALAPFVSEAARAGRGLFVLVRTSNPGHADLQGLHLVDGGRVVDAVARLVADVGAPHRGRCGRSLVGAVVGLTAPPDEVAALRRLMPDTLFLMPGYGAQGGSLASYRAALDARGGGVLVSASRSLTQPWSGPPPPDWRERILAALAPMRDALRRAPAE